MSFTGARYFLSISNKDISVKLIHTHFKLLIHNRLYIIINYIPVTPRKAAVNSSVKSISISFPSAAVSNMWLDSDENTAVEDVFARTANTAVEDVFARTANTAVEDVFARTANTAVEDVFARTADTAVEDVFARTADTAVEDVFARTAEETTCSRSLQ